MLDNHDMTITQSGVFVADTSLNASNTNLIGIGETGLQYDL